MSYFLETIKTNNEGVSTSEIAKYHDEMTAAIFYHSTLNTIIRCVQNGEYKAVYANVHNESGVIIRQERWAIPEPEPTPEEVTTP